MVPGQQEVGRLVEKDKSPRSRLYALWVILAAGAALSIGAYFLVRSWEDAAVRTSFEMLSAGHATSVNVELTRHFDVSDALVGLYVVSQQVERRQFDQFTATILASHNDIQALMWVPRVAPTGRSNLIKQTERDGIKDFRIRNVDGSEASATVTPQADHFPILYVQPIKENRDLLGIDLMADPRYRGLLEMACDTGRLAVSGPVQLDFKAGDDMGDGVLLARAIYRKGANLGSVTGRREGLEGFVLQLFRIDDLIHEALRESAVLGVNISVVYRGNPDELQLKNLHPSVSRDEKNIKSFSLNVARSTSALQLRVPLDHLGKPWSLMFTPTPRFWANNQAWTSLVVLAAGLFATLLSGICLLRPSAKSSQS